MSGVGGDTLSSGEAFKLSSLLGCSCSFAFMGCATVALLAWLLLLLCTETEEAPLSMLSNRDSGEVELPPPAKLLVGSLPLSLSCTPSSTLDSPVPDDPAPWALFDKPKVLDLRMELFGAKPGSFGTEGRCIFEVTSLFGAIVKVKSCGADLRRTEPGKGAVCRLFCEVCAFFRKEILAELNFILSFPKDALGGTAGVGGGLGTTISTSPRMRS